MTKRFEGKDGKLTTLHGCEVEWVPDKSGKLAPNEIPGSDFSVNTDMVLLAMGFTPQEENPFAEELNLTVSPNGCIACDEKNMTSKPGVFVAGDMNQGASLVVKALANGKHVSDCVGSYLSERPSS